METTGVMETTMQDSGFCSTCEESGNTTPASNWCADCKTYFCNKCIKLHMKISNYSDHHVTKKIGNKRMKVGGKFMCKDHDKKIKYFCRICFSPVCTVSKHKRCKDVVTIKNMLPEVNGYLLKRQKKLNEAAERNKSDVANFDDEVDKFKMKSASVKTDITNTIESAVVCLREKEAELQEKLYVQTDQQTEKLRSGMEAIQTETQMYQQQSQLIKQALESNDEAQLFEIYLSPGLEGETGVKGTQIEDRQVVDDIQFMHDPATLTEEITKMDVRSAGYIMDETPALYEVIEARLCAPDRCDVRDAVIMNSSGIKVTVFVDIEADRLKSFYHRGGKACSSVLKLEGSIWCVTVISEGKVAVSCHNVTRIVTVAVTPDLELLSTIQTSKMYFGLSSLDSSTLVAGSESPPTVDLIDMEGNILKTFTTIPALEKSFCNPRYIHVTLQGTILVSDLGLKSVICLTQVGDMTFTFTPAGDRELKYPYGVTSSSAGDIFVADWGTHKVVHLSDTGKYIRDFLTEEDGLKSPFGLCFDEDKLCVTVRYKGLHKYKFAKK